MSVLDRHLAKFTGSQATALRSTVRIIRAALPGAAEVISYGMPTFKVDGPTGTAVIGLEGFRAHNSVFPYSAGVLREFSASLVGYPQTKGSIHFSLDRAFPEPLLKRILRARIREINAVYPKASGQHREFYDNGFLKFAGNVKDGEQHGDWKWFRRDGTIMRSGSFRAGTQTGVWVTYDRNGHPHKVTSRR